MVLQVNLYTDGIEGMPAGFSEDVYTLYVIQLFPQGIDQGQKRCVSSKVAFFQYGNAFLAKRGL